MVRIRLRRVGARNQPSFRIVAVDSRVKRDGKYLENLGFYNPRTDPPTVVVHEERVYHWLSNGAQPSESVERIFNMIGLRQRYERFKAGEDLDALLAEAQEAQAPFAPGRKTSAAAVPSGGQ
ncbi:MAG: 30S ribosomal protein S16 [Chloroflexi bacterium]|nr:30S ribosomal protein S16 [Chloroflexota bacterium]